MDKTEIYYFSGTGNSLVVARDIAEKMKGNLISIPSMMDKERITTDADIVGIVFPVYWAQAWGIPLIIERFIKKLENLDSKYIFAVCTCGGIEIVNGIPTLINLDKIIKASGGNLAANFSVHLPMNTMAVMYSEEGREKLFNKWKEKLEIISECVNAREDSKNKKLHSLINLSMSPLFLIIRQLILKELKRLSNEYKSNLNYHKFVPLTDRSFNINENCVGCGTCAKVCPVHNVKLIDNKPVWQHNCEMCLACREWCPNEAIHSGLIADEKRYHHPDVKISDMLRND